MDEEQRHGYLKNDEQAPQARSAPIEKLLEGSPVATLRAVHKFLRFTMIKGHSYFRLPACSAANIIISII
jgi:hypothetical protein